MPTSPTPPSPSYTPAPGVQARADSARAFWLAIPVRGPARLVAVQGDHEMEQLHALLGGAFVQVPVAKRKEDRLALCYRSLAATAETRNDRASALLGATATGLCVLAQRRESEALLNAVPREGRRYVKPFLRADAERLLSSLFPTANPAT